MYETINERLRESFYSDPRISSQLKQYETEVLEDRKSSFVAASELLDIYFNRGNK